MPAVEPKFRHDLVVSEQDARGQASFVIKDPETGRFLRFGEAEHFIARQLDGKTPLTEVQARVAEKFGATNRLESLEGFIERLRKAGLLEPPYPQNEWRTKAPKRVRGSFLYLRLKAFDPDVLLSQLARRFSFVFSRGFVLASASTILFALGVLIANWGEIQLDVYRLYRTQALFLAWLTALFVTALHEFAHGLTCKHFGRSVREMGFLLIYFQPALYCNVSDAWLIPEKSKRMWVSFAGAYFEFFLWAVATLTWRITDPSTVLHNSVLIVMATSAIKSFFNLNPLIKLDGYYALSDYLEIPNLRQKAMRYMSAVLRRPWRLLNPTTNDPSWRQRGIYLTYGLLASVYSWSLLGIVAWNTMKYLVARYQGLGFVTASVLIGAVVRQTLPRAVPSPQQPPEPKPRALLTTTRRLFKPLAFAAAALAVLVLVPMRLTVTGNFRILPAQKAEVRSEVDGVIDQVFVDEGDTVKAGTPIARLSGRDIRAEVQKTEAQIQEQEARLKMLKIGARPEELQLARTTQQEAQERVPFARKQLDRAQTLFREGLAAQKEIDAAAEELAVRQKEFEEASDKLRLVLAGSRREEITATEAGLARLDAEQRYLEEQRRLLLVTSPISGVITSHRLKETIGQHVLRGDLIAEVDELDSVEAEIAVPEREIGDVRPGQHVEVKSRAYPEKTFTGVIASIGTKAAREDDTLEGKSILATTRLDNSSVLLKSGMTGSAKILCGRRRAMDLLRRRIAKSIRVEFWSWW
jgi:putative peptide zinc metalloprotease protein